jgi:hypothetical protein
MKVKQAGQVPSKPQPRLTLVPLEARIAPTVGWGE